MSDLEPVIDTCVCTEECLSGDYDEGGHCLEYEVFTEEELEEETAEGGWGHWVKIFFITLKVAYVCVLLGYGMRAHTRKRGCGIPQMILAFYIFCLVVLLWLDTIGPKLIAAFFMITFFANYMNFWSLMYLVRNVETTEGVALRRRTRVYFYVMNFLYIFVACVAIFWLRPVCKYGKLYPYVFNWSAMLFVFNALYHFIIHSMDYGLLWE